MPLEDVKAPTLVLGAVDDGLSSFDNARKGAGRIPDSQFVTFESGGHLLLGAEAAVRDATSQFIVSHSEK